MIIHRQYYCRWTQTTNGFSLHKLTIYSKMTLIFLATFPLKGQCHKIFLLRPLINQLKYFLLWLQIRRDIRNFKNSPLYNTAVSRDSLAV
jgi:hypothetical protein